MQDIEGPTNNFIRERREVMFKTEPYELLNAITVAKANLSRRNPYCFISNRHESEFEMEVVIGVLQKEIESTQQPKDTE